MIRYATFGRRAWGVILAIVVDLFVLSLLSAIVSGSKVWIPFAVWYFIHHVALVTEGGNLGHRLAGVRVVREDGERVGMLPALFRQLSLLFVSVPPLGLGLLWMLDQPQGRTWHDIIGGTVVVRERALLEQRAPDWADDAPWRRPKAPVVEAVPVAVDSPSPGSQDAPPAPPA